MKGKFFRILAFVFLGIGVIPNANAKVVEIALQGVVASKLIGQFEDAASRLLYEGENHGNALIVSLGNQLRIASLNAELVLSKQQNTLYENLGNNQQAFFTQLNAIIRAAQGSVDRAVSVLEVANLNLIELTNRLPLTDKTYTYMNSAKGMTQPFQETDYQFSFTGLGFGQDDEDRQYRITASLDGQELPATAINRTPPYDLTLQVSPDVLRSKFDDKKVRVIPLTITLTATLREPCWLVLKCTEEKSASWPLKVTLLPRLPGEIEGTEIIKGEALDGVVKTTSVTVTTSGCKSDRPCDWSREVPVAENQRIVGVRYSCTGQCGWSYALRKGGYDPDFDILDGGRKAVVYRHVDGENSTTVTYYVDYQTLKPTVTEKTIAPQRIAFNKPVTIKLSPENSACVYRLNAKLVTGQDIFIDNGMSESADGLFVRLSAGTGPAGVACSPTFQLNMP